LSRSSEHRDPHQFEPTYRAGMPSPRLDALGIFTTDLTRSLAFYRLLGLDIPTGVESERHVECTLANGLRLMWDTDPDAATNAPGATPATGSGIAMAFLCASPAEVDTTYAAVTSEGFTGHLAPWDAFWGQRYATLHDPDGNTVDLFAPLT
jgi:uncharacterized glyoxalase superfamily protein PhnB